MTTTIIITTGGTPVDEYEKGSTCPAATKDEVLNARNKKAAVEDEGYRNPSQDGGFRKDEVCSSCANFNQTPSLMACLTTGTERQGYCQKMKFLCEELNTCEVWCEGGPMKDVADGSNRDIL